MDRHAETLQQLRELARDHPQVAVSYSGGKDSLVVLDLALRCFERVVPFYMYLVPGLDADDQRLAYCKQRFGLDVLRLPHPLAISAWKTCTYCDPLPEYDLLPDFTPAHVDALVMNETGCTRVLVGMKRSDGIFRRRDIANASKDDSPVVLPIRDWLRLDVLSYLKGRDIRIPDASRTDNSSISFLTTDLLFLYDNHRSDFDLLATYFPHIEVVPIRRAMFGRTDG